MSNPVYLKIKLKSLAAESRIIAHQERKSWGSVRDALHLHRKIDVRSEARAAHIAYAYIRGRTYQACENRQRDDRPKVRWDRVASMVKKFHPDPTVRFFVDKEKQAALGARLEAWATAVVEEIPRLPEEQHGDDEPRDARIERQPSAQTVAAPYCPAVGVHRGAG